MPQPLLMILVPCGMIARIAAVVAWCECWTAMSMSGSVANCQIVGVRSDGAKVSIVFEVGVPYRDDQAGAELWRCPVSLEPLYTHLVHTAGSDSMQALCMALSLGLDLLGKFVEDGGLLLHDDGTDFSLKPYAFGHAVRGSTDAM
jgi:hypothetical protein